MKITPTIITLFIIANCSYGQKIEISCPIGSTLDTMKFRTEIVYACEVNDTLNGPSIIYSKSGKIVEENYWTHGTKSGIWKTYTSDEKLHSEEKFDLDGKSSVKTFYYSNGKMQTVTTYSNNKKNGRVAEWFEDGIQNTEGNFVNDIQDGIWMFRMPDLKTVTVIEFKNGKEMSVKNVTWEGPELPLSLSSK